VGRPATRASVTPKYFFGHFFVWRKQQMCSRTKNARTATPARVGLGRGTGNTPPTSNRCARVRGRRGGGRKSGSRGRLGPITVGDPAGCALWLSAACAVAQRCVLCGSRGRLGSSERLSGGCAVARAGASAGGPTRTATGAGQGGIEQDVNQNQRRPGTRRGRSTEHME
jgi:hypothetical protein